MGESLELTEVFPLMVTKMITVGETTVTVGEGEVTITESVISVKTGRNSSPQHVKPDESNFANKKSPKPVKIVIPHVTYP